MFSISMQMHPGIILALPPLGPYIVSSRGLSTEMTLPVTVTLIVSPISKPFAWLIFES